MKRRELGHGILVAIAWAVIIGVVFEIVNIVSK